MQTKVSPSFLFISNTKKRNSFCYSVNEKEGVKVLAPVKKVWDARKAEVKALRSESHETFIQLKYVFTSLSSSSFKDVDQEHILPSPTYKF